MSFGAMLVTVSIAAPGFAALLSGLRGRVSVPLCLAYGAMVASLWSVVVGLILVIARDTTAGGPAWAMVLTAVALVEWWAREQRRE